MINQTKLILTVIFCYCITACQPKPTPKEALETKIRTQIDSIEGDVAVALLNLAEPSDTLFINESEEFHAASTMKVPVMIELFKQQASGKINLNDSILLINEFKSIVDSSPYSMDIGDDSNDVIYSKINTNVALKDLMYSMITVSSNLATNVLIELVDAKKVTATMRDLGADKIEVLRGVEDQKAYDLGLSNSTTAKDLLIIMQAIATNKAGTETDCEAMINILKDQQFNEIIPHELPDNVEVAHKTGSITGVHHDAGIVYLPDGRSYVLVLLSKNLKDFDKGTEQLAGISKTIYDYLMEQ
ncbi:serine hydrolase [Flagellimonas zhangzhouensis]|uniref:beta-lactamase n=1 Tax=Flagellimonas zhangzhouensis TaxID=1073328 RepID=A0A1H2SEW6_9FLAO|nr:serine hydrolase [Allomuricauda zhangzhouensis]SDQ73927.1 beta-lactamase class A [Allomuricauda zhangzhouensis]SDW30048.1 beta-lactamase class A [Allomuricauda zhangzhouensis]